MDLEKEYLIYIYYTLGFQHKEILYTLASQHNVIIGLRTLKRIMKKLHMCRRKHFSGIGSIAEFLEQQIQTSGQLHGYKWLHLKCIQSGFVVTQNTVLQLLRSIDPIGINLRKRKRLQRRQYSNGGPNYLWHMDSYDKLKPYGISINGCIDGFSREIIWLRASSTSNDPKVIGGYYVNAIEALGGIPRSVRGDMGTENGYVEQMQVFLRNVSGVVHGMPAFIYGTSTSNQRIEAWWATLRKHNSQFWMNLFQKIKEDHYFNGTFLDKSLIQFCFMKQIQDELDNLVMEWSSHRIRRTRNATAPTGRPIMMYHSPELYHGRDYLTEIDSQYIEMCKEECVYLSEVCDEDVANLCKFIMERDNLQHPQDAFEGVDLYLSLRNEILENL